MLASRFGFQRLEAAFFVSLIDLRLGEKKLMTPKQCFYEALSNKMPERVPTLAKIWVDLSCAIVGSDLRQVVEEPELAMRVVVEAARGVKTDGARLFHFPRRKMTVQGSDVFEVDNAGNVIGVVDMQGGLATQVRDSSIIELEDVERMAFIQFWKTEEPLVVSVDDAKRIAVPGKEFYEQVGFGDLERQLLNESGEDMALIGDCGPATLAFLIFFRGYQRSLFDLIEQPDLVHAVMEKGAAHAIAKGKFHIDNGIRMLRLNDSPANMLVISPQNFRDYILGHMKDVCTELHNYCPEVRIYCHICGNIMPVMDELVETGLDCIGCLDPLGNFTCAQAREAVGYRAALMGGVNTLSFIDSTPGEIMEQARGCIEGSGSKGGYVLGSGCVIPRNAVRENLLALAEAAEKFGTKQYLQRIG